MSRGSIEGGLEINESRVQPTVHPPALHRRVDVPEQKSVRCHSGAALPEAALLFGNRTLQLQEEREPLCDKGREDFVDAGFLCNPPSRRSLGGTSLALGD